MTNNDDKVIYLSDYIDTSDVEQNQSENGNIELSFGSFDEVDEYLTTSESCYKKLNKLKEEKYKLEKMKTYLEASIYEFQNTDDYILDMASKQEEIKIDLKKEVAASVGSIITSLMGSYAFFASLNNIEDNASLITNIVFLLITLISILIATRTTSNSIEDYKEYKQYDKEINKYSKLLERTLK